MMVLYFYLEVLYCSAIYLSRSMFTFRGDLLFFILSRLVEKAKGVSIPIFYCMLVGRQLGIF